MIMRVIRYSVLAMLAAILVYIMVGIYFQPDPVQLGEQAPDFRKTDLSGRPVTLSQYLGKKIVINFFTTWCEPCRQEAPDLAKFNDQLPSNVVFLMVDRKEPQTIVQRFANEFHLTNPIVIDANDELALPYGITGQPETFLVDSKGVVRFHQLGPLTVDQLNQLLAQVE